MATNYDGNRAMNGNNLYTFWVTIKALILGWLGQKQNTITGGASTITGDNLDKNRALISNGNGKVAVSGVTSTELGYLGGVTGNVQTQLDAKQGNLNFRNNISKDSSNNVDVPIANTTDGIVTSGVISTQSDDITTATADNYDFTSPALYGGKLGMRIADTTNPGVVTLSIGKFTSDMIGVALSAPNFPIGKNSSNQLVAGVGVMTATAYGVAKVFSNTTQTEAANAVTATAGRTYGVQKNSSGQLVVNVPWTDTPTDISGKQDKIKVGTATSGAVTTISAGTNITISISGSTATINNTYSYTLLAATDDALGGIKTGFSDNDSTQDAVIRRAVSLQTQKAYVSIPYATDSVKGVAAFGNTMSVSGGVANVDTGSSALRNGLLMTTEEPGLVFLTSSEAAASASQYVGYSATYLNTQFSTVNTALGQKAPLASPDFSGTPTIGGNAIATQSYVDSAITGAETYKGTLASEADLKACGNFKAGWYWRVALPSGTSTATIAGQTVESGDMVYCNVTHNHTAGAAITNANFNVVNTNIVFLTDTEIAEIVNAAS